jgi:hypothetical protein
MTQVVISGMRIKPNKGVEDITAYLGADAMGDGKYAGGCSACGKWHGAVAERLMRSNVDCATDFYREWRRKMWEQSIFDAVFHLIGGVRVTADQPTSLAEVAMYYGDEVEAILWDMTSLVRGWKAVTMLYGFEDRMFGFAEARCKEIPCTISTEMYPYMFGNNVFLQSKEFGSYLQYAQTEKGFLQGIDLPARSDDSFTSKMRQGNLRSDGVI